MKIQSTNNKQHIKKTQKKQTTATSFDAMLNATQMDSAPTNTEQTINPNIDKQPQTSSNPQQTLETHVQALEEALHNLEAGQGNPEHIQQTIVDLRQALQQSELTAQDLHDADTLLAVEAKRINKLSNKAP